MPYPKKKNETKSEYISRCIPYVVKEGTAKDEKQAAAICYSMWDKKKNEEKMSNIIDKYILNEKKEKEDDGDGEKWSGDVETKWTPKEGLFTQSASKIATYLAANSDSLKQAMSRLNFYINRAGDNLSTERKLDLDRAKELLRRRYGKEKEE